MIRISLRRVLLGCGVFVLLPACSRPPAPPPQAPSVRDLPAVILNGDFADPTILRDGEDFYLTHSSFNAVPGLPIWHSKNLREWKMITRALHSYVGSVWSPEIIKHDGLFYIYFPAKGTNWVITAKSPVGPWSDPVDLKIGGIDPGHVVGPEGKRYLHLSAGKAVELAGDGLSVVGEPAKVYEGWTYPADWVDECFCLESPKLAIRQGKFYLTSAQGGTAGPATSHMAVSARSDSPLGPWENSPYNPIVRTESPEEAWWSKGHGTIFDGGQDEWYIVYHAWEKGFRSLGRQVILEPIEWKADGWFVVPGTAGKKFDPRLIQNHKIVSDDFSAAELRLQWQFDGSQLGAEYLIEDGVLALPSLARKTTVLYAQTADHSYDASIRLSPEPGMETGFGIYYNPATFVGLGRDAKGSTLFMGAEAAKNNAAECPNCEFFRIRVEGNALLLFLSEDGSNWKRYPRAFDLSAFAGNPRGGFSAAKLAVFARGKGNVKVDDFRYETLPWPR